MGNEEATRTLLQHRRVLFAYILAIVRDHTLAEDLFQEVSLVILRRWEEFGSVADFWALARGIARRQALASLRKAGRDPLLLSEGALDSVDRGFDRVAGEVQARHDALRDCLNVLPELWRKILQLRYWNSLPVAAVAIRLDKSQNTISVTLNRIRSRLADCVRQKVRATEAL